MGLLEELGKSGYKPNMKHKSSIMLLYFWLHTKTKFRNLVLFHFLVVELFKNNHFYIF
jgi:hypothetical protein